MLRSLFRRSFTSFHFLCILTAQTSSCSSWFEDPAGLSEEINSVEENFKLFDSSVVNFYYSRREFYGNFYHTECGNLVFYGHSGDFRHTRLCFYYACGNIRHTEYGNNSHTVDFHTVL